MSRSSQCNDYEDKEFTQRTMLARKWILYAAPSSLTADERLESGIPCYPEKTDYLLPAAAVQAENYQNEEEDPGKRK